MSKLNIIIDKFGNIHDALPSHQKAIESVTQTNAFEVAKKMSQEELQYFQYSFACLTNCLMVWEREICGIPNRLQILTLLKLKQNGKYLGNIPAIGEECNIYIKRF